MSASALQRTLGAIEKQGKPVDLLVIKRQYRKAVQAYIDEPGALLFLADRVTPYLGATHAFLELLTNPHVDPVCIESMFFTRLVGMVSPEDFRAAVIMLRVRRPDVYAIVFWRFAELAEFFHDADEALTPIFSQTEH